MIDRYDLFQIKRFIKTFVREYIEVLGDYGSQTHAKVKA